MAVGSNHRMLVELAALYLRTKFYIWPVAVEPNGFEGRNYDCVGLQSKAPQSIIAIEAKSSYEDLMRGLKKKQFDPSKHITHLYLAYQGGFDTSSLPKNIGILKVRNMPICQLHDLRDSPNECGDKCKNKKNIFYFIERPAISWWDKKEQKSIYTTRKNDWLWAIATSNTTKLVNIIEANVCYDPDEE
jgi:hypothetical protein